jgi:hypothetical protein
MIGTLLKLLPFASSLVKAWRETVAFFTGRAQREAGRNEEILEQKKATDAEIDKAVAARQDQRARNDADPTGGVRENDPYLRD